MQAIEIQRMTVRRDRVIADVRVVQPALQFTSPSLAAKVRQAFPLVDYHDCVNEAGSTFGACIDSTPLPHLLEHLVIDLQMREAAAIAQTNRTADMPPENTTYVGTTEWTDESSGRARIEVNFTDDLVVLRAFRDAIRFLNSVVVL